MLTYTDLKDKAKEFLTATGLNLEEFPIVLAAFESAYRKVYPLDQTYAGKARQRRVGGGDKGKLDLMEDKLLFILVYLKTNPLQTMHGLQFEMSQPQANYWIHRLLLVLQGALADLKLRPERDSGEVAARLLGAVEPPSLLVDGTERRRQRPTDGAKQKAH